MTSLSYKCRSCSGNFVAGCLGRGSSEGKAPFADNVAPPFLYRAGLIRMRYGNRGQFSGVRDLVSESLASYAYHVARVPPMGRRFGASKSRWPCVVGYGRF